MSNVHVITHRSPPRAWHTGLPLGNGFLGALGWGDGNPLKFTLDCADLWDSRMDDSFWRHPDYNYANLRKLVEEGEYDRALAIFGYQGHGMPEEAPATPVKISVGRAEFNLGEMLEYEMRLDNDRAILAGRLETTTGVHSITAFVHRAADLFCLRIEDAPAEAELELRPLCEINKDFAATLGHPAAHLQSDGARRVYSQEIPGGPCYALVWNARGPDYFLAIACAEDVKTAEEEAAAIWQAAVGTGFDELRLEHEAAWSGFWAKSAVYLPEPAIELLWFYGLYLLGSSARPGAMPPGLQGLWAMDGVIPPWRGDYHLDMNVQETFWPACASGHLELMDCWCDYMRDCLPRAREFTRKVFGTEGTYWPGELVGKYYKFFPTGVWYPLMAFAWSHSGFTGWLAWLRWRYTMDTAWLRKTGYPIVSDIFRFYRDNLVEESDGYLHVPLSTSPEYGTSSPEESIAKDPNIDLALIRRCCDWVMEMETALGVDDLSAAAKSIRARLAPYALSERNELCLWPDKLLDTSHLHPSHLMAIHPAMDLTTDGDQQQKRIIEASVRQYLALGEAGWGGHTYAQMISFAAVLGRGAWAYDCVRQYMDHFVWPNGLHHNCDLETNRYQAAAPGWHKSDQRTRDRYLGAKFTMEACCAVSAGISDMLLQGWGDTVRVFPAVPAHWRDLVFHDLLTEGAFRVSAARRMGQTVWVSVTATVDRALRLRDPFDGAAVEAAGCPAQRANGLFSVALAQGRSITLQRRGYAYDPVGAVGHVRKSAPTGWGLTPGWWLPAQ